MLTEAVDLREEFLHILTTNVIADTDLPLADDSSMDGCGTRSSDSMDDAAERQLPTDAKNHSPAAE